MLGIVKQLFPHEFRQRLKRRLFSHQDMKTRLANLSLAGFSPAAAVDGGAYQGDWTRLFWETWPGRPSLMIEPLPTQRGVLESLAAETAGSAVVSNALGRKRGEVRFVCQETNSGVASEQDMANTIVVPCTTLDTILDERDGIQPDLLKLDLQGHELEALAGCEKRLRQFEVVILEVSVIRIGDVPTFSEVDRFMNGQGYRLYDVLPQYYRPRDGALWQMDVFYVREDSALNSSRSWD
jgi:FkbM family methyltransferase